MEVMGCPVWLYAEDFEGGENILPISLSCSLNAPQMLQRYLLVHY